jgi:hypothetical protein
MKKLETEIKVQNRILKQLKRERDVAIYELFGANGMLYGYEVIIIKVRKDREAFGVFIQNMKFILQVKNGVRLVGLMVRIIKKKRSSVSADALPSS